MKHLYIIRGLPGSGKTTLAYHIADEVFEADQFFHMTGVYNYEREKIGEAHRWCQNRTQTAMMDEIPKIAVSNTFVKRWEMQPYYHMAEIYGYSVFEITMSGEIRKNHHAVPEETIQRMRETWEK